MNPTPLSLSVLESLTSDLRRYEQAQRRSTAKLSAATPWKRAVTVISGLLALVGSHSL